MLDLKDERPRTLKSHTLISYINYTLVNKSSLDRIDMGGICSKFEFKGGFFLALYGVWVRKGLASLADRLSPPPPLFFFFLFFSSTLSARV